jgi:hypothetical protein
VRKFFFDGQSAPGRPGNPADPAGKVRDAETRGLGGRGERGCQRSILLWVGLPPENKNLFLRRRWFVRWFGG